MNEQVISCTTFNNRKNIIHTFLKPFREKMKDYFNICFDEDLETDNLLLNELKNLYPGPTFCIGCHINAFKLCIIDSLNQDISSLCKLIIVPTIIDILIDYEIDIYGFETLVIEEWYLEKEKKTKPVSLEIIDKINKQPTRIVSDHRCFCGDDDNKEVIQLGCCGKHVHKNCLLEWFKTNNTCPYCRNVFEINYNKS